MKAIAYGLFGFLIGMQLTPAPLQAAQQAARSGAVFVMTNAANKNQVITYERTPDGQLLNGSRYDTGGRGSGGVTDPLEAQGSLTLSEDHSLLFAANAGSGSISVFSVRKATLTLVDEKASGGSQPVAIAQHGSSVFVLNSGGSGTVTGFTVDSNGQLKRVNRSSGFLSANATGGASLSISADGQTVIVTERLANNIDTFHVNGDGSLGPLVVNPSPGLGAFSAAVTPAGTLIVSEVGAGGSTDSAVSSYSILPNGKLSAISQSVPTLGMANCWNAVTPDGKFVYVSNAGSASISGFALGGSGALTPVGGTIVGNNPENSTNLDIAVSADSRYLYTLNSGAGNVGVFAIQQNGTLLNLGQAGDLAASAGFNGIAAF